MHKLGKTQQPSGACPLGGDHDASPTVNTRYSSCNKCHQLWYNMGLWFIPFYELNDYLGKRDARPT